MRQEVKENKKLDQHKDSCYAEMIELLTSVF